MKFFKFVLFFGVVMSCKEPTKEPFAPFNEFIQQDIAEALNTKNDKITYLTNLFDFDQSLRNPEHKVDILKRNAYNTDSNEYQSYLKEMIRGDSISFMLAKRYLEQYGYPKFETANYKAKSAIITVALHQDYSKQEVLFPYINEAYNTGKVEVNRFSFLVNRMYAFKFGERFEAKKGMTEKENINRIIKALDVILI